MRKLFIIFIIQIIFQIVFLANCRLGLANTTSLDHIQHTKYAVQVSLQDKLFYVELAEGEQEMSRGLMHRKSLLEDQGMLFVYKKSKFFSFWMKNTPVKIDIAFFDEENKFVEIKTMHPLSKETHRSRKKGYYALEMRSGWYDDNKILLGSEFKIQKKVLLNTLNKNIFSSLP